MSANTRADGLNVLVLVVDDLRPEIGAYGVEIVRTPNIDALAERGVRFNRAYVQQATCTVSRASLFSGLRPDSMGLKHIDMKRLREKQPQHVMWPQYFKNHGYYTASFGKVYHRNEADPASWDKRGKKVKGLYCSPENKRFSWRVPGPPVESAVVPDNCYRTGKVVDQAVGELKQLVDVKFFMAVGLYKPHLPFTAPKKYWDLYSEGDIHKARKQRKLVGVSRYTLTNYPELRAFMNVPKSGPIPEQLAQKLVHGYYAATSYSDAQIGRIMNELDRLGLRDKTIVVLFGDHGWKLGEYNSWAKQTNLELDTRAPLIISVPGSSQVNKASNALVEFIDIYPTVSDLAGLTAPESIDGSSFLALLRNPALAFKSAAFSQFPRRGGVMGYAMRTDRYRYVEWRTRGFGDVLARELYDHNVDDKETENIIDRATDALKRQLASKLASQIGVASSGHF